MVLSTTSIRSGSILGSLLYCAIAFAGEPQALETARAAGLAPALGGMQVAVHGAHNVGNDCVSSPTTLCLQQNRFRVEVGWRDFRGDSGAGQLVPLTSDNSGLFWFFDEDNWELLVKVLDGCSFNDRFWVFSAATTNVEYTLRVTDHLAAITKEYHNPLGNAAPTITDVDAFPTCFAGPSGLLLFANPSTLPVLGKSLITMIARGPDGLPVGAGKRIRLIPDLGTIINEVFTDQNGEAEAIFTAGEQPGTGSVAAILDGEALETVFLTIRDAVASIVLSADPAVVYRFADSTIQLRVRAVNFQGQPFPGQLIFFDTEVGAFDPGPTVLTNSLGEADVLLIVTADDLVDFPPFGEFRVTATTHSEGNTLSVRLEITVIG